ncbi:hypothetical protein HaLaN_27719 [Haematococcus lacustris]|uniref:Uncharacterized protein n=1 Tax=Haematococcus lacustris TaxID=44745 RepID=A0A6A0AAK6_HAELA|nr:hypothetical protein HaLaN_27719 [Haematococcus lacustris]
MALMQSPPTHPAHGPGGQWARAPPGSARVSDIASWWRNASEEAADTVVWPLVSPIPFEALWGCPLTLRRCPLEVPFGGALWRCKSDVAE